MGLPEHKTSKQDSKTLTEKLIHKTKEVMKRSQRKFSKPKQEIASYTNDQQPRKQAE